MYVTISVESGRNILYIHHYISADILTFFFFLSENPCLVVFEKPFVVKENETVTLTCFTLNSCPSNVQIEDMTKLSSKKLSTSVHTYGQHKSTTVNFTADWKDDGKEFSCQTQDNADKYLIRNVSVTVECKFINAEGIFMSCRLLQQPYLLQQYIHILYKGTIHNPTVN